VSKLRIVLRVSVLLALAAVVRSEARPAEFSGTCGYCDPGYYQCPGLGQFIDMCEVWCGAGTYATACYDHGCGRYMWVSCGLIS
jgi:hypothetical protein